MVWINDVHAQMSATNVGRIAKIRSLEDLQATLTECHKQKLPVSIAGGKHSLGRQPFITGGVVLDTRDFNQVLALEERTGIVRLQGGCMWPDLQSYLMHRKADWEIHQKQTGADTMSIAGSIAVNAHGNALRRGPISSDVLWLQVVLADGSQVHCDRHENSELFALAFGGMGLFGVISEVGLQLAPRHTFRRVSSVSSAVDVAKQWSEDITYSYGDMQLDIDPTTDSFLNLGVLNQWEPWEDPPSDPAPSLNADWGKLVTLAHVDKKRAFQEYCAYAQSVDGRIESRADFQWRSYKENYHKDLERKLALPESAEILAEFFIPPSRLPSLLNSARHSARCYGIDLILATLRSIRKCEVSFLRWAKQDYVCLVFAIHTEDNVRDLNNTDQFCRQVAETCCQNQGSFYLPYRRFYVANQLRRAYPNLDSLPEKKSQYDPMNMFNSDWYDAVCKMSFEATCQG